VKDAANRVGKAWSGSWLGYHADVYYEGLQAPPPGANFSQEWGLVDRTYGRDTTGSWQQFNPDDVKQVIMQMAGEPDLEPARKLADEAGKAFDVQKSDVLSLLITENSDSPDPYLETLKTDAENTVIHTSSEILRIWQPKGSVMTRDTLALGRGRRSPPHLSVLADVTSLHHPFTACSALSAIARKAGSHILRKRRQRRKAEIVGTNIFIGHGQSLLWKDLKDFINERLKLPWEEFNRVPIAGLANVARLSEMLDSAAIAFLIMTGEDEQTDGSLHARMNVVHEAGLFQGRLGFARAIILLEEGCKEFSNIHGLGQL
jgi:hypothetical protein